MAERRIIGLCAAVIISAAALTGCSRKELPLEEPVIREEHSREDIASSYPKIVKLPGDKRIDLVMYTEGCYCLFDGSYYGFMTEEGEEITPCIYEQADPFSEGLACVYLDGKYGYIGKDGETELPFIYDQASSFTEGLAYFRIGEDYGFIDHEGNMVLRPDCDSVSSFQEGLAYFSIDGLYGYLDKAGRIVVEPVYEDAGYFWDGLAKVMRNGSYGVIGIEGEEILSPEYDSVSVTDGFIIAEKDGCKYSFDRNGKVLFESEYDNFFLIPEKELVIIENDGSYGVTDYTGEEIIPFVYSRISYDSSGAGGLKVTCEEMYEGEQETRYHRSYGYFGFSENGSFEEIPPVYDHMSSFQGDRAVVGIQEKYGIIRRDGSMEYPIEYDRINLFENGSMALWMEGVAKIIDGDGNVIHSGEYVNITLRGGCYEVQKDGKYGFLNEWGEQMIPVVYSYSNTIYGAENILSMENYSQDINNLLIKTDKGEGTALPEVFLQNHITPRVKEYMKFLQSDAPNLRELDQPSRNFSKLYGMGGEGELLLYFYAVPYEKTGFPLSSSSFFVFRDGKTEQLAAGYECGGSLRGDFICFWYDKAESRVKPGVSGAWGGFGGFAYGGKVYEAQGEGMEQSASWSSVSQTSRNYDQKELLENAELFYDDHYVPYTKETILGAEVVTEYEVDGERTTQERFEEIYSRYRYMDALDLYFY